MRTSRRRPAMIDNKVVLITGASSGMGRATAELLSGRGYRVFGTSRDPASVPPLADVEMLTPDVRDEASVEACVAAVLGKAGRVDGVVKCAGFGLVGGVEGTMRDDT